VSGLLFAYFDPSTFEWQLHSVYSIFPSVEGKCAGLSLLGDEFRARFNSGINFLADHNRMHPFRIESLKQMWSRSGLGVLQPPVQKQWLKHDKTVAVVRLGAKYLPRVLQDLTGAKIHGLNNENTSIKSCQVRSLFPFVSHMTITFFLFLGSPFIRAAPALPGCSTISLPSTKRQSKATSGLKPSSMH
jgi:hypothetical protein